MTRRSFALLGAATAAALLLQATPALAHAPVPPPAWDHPDRHDDHRGWDRDCRHDDRRGWDDRRHDGRYYYPRPAYYVSHLPRGHRIVYHRGLPHYYYRGTWYAPWHGRYAVIAAPVGIVVNPRGHW